MKRAQRSSAVFGITVLCVLTSLSAYPTLADTILPASAPVQNAERVSSQSDSKAPRVQWSASYQAALKTARETGKPIMIDFYATWCGPCKLLDKAYGQPVLIAELKKWVSLKVDTDNNQELARRHGVEGLPTLLFLDSQGKEIGRQVGLEVDSSVDSNNEKELIAGVAAGVVASLKKHYALIDG